MFVQTLVHVFSIASTRGLAVEEAVVSVELAAAERPRTVLVPVLGLVWRQEPVFLRVRLGQLVR